MAKRKLIGNVNKRTEDKTVYIKINEDINLKKGTYLNLENEKTQIAALEYSLSQGWVKEEDFESRKAQIVSYWNDPVSTKDGKSFVRKNTTVYQVTLSTKE